MSNLITSRANPLVKQLRALAERKFREKRGEFLVEGIQPVLHALACGADVRLLVVAPDLLTSALAQRAVQAYAHRGRVVHVTGAVFQTLAEREHPTGLAAVVGMRTRTLEELRVESTSVFVALYEVGNPGNLGTIVRTVDAVGGSGVILIGAATDPFHPTAVKASRGALFGVPLVRLAHAQEWIAWCRQRGVRIVTTSDKAPTDLWSADLTPPLALVFGSEGQGLPDELLEQGESVRIPMAGIVDSLNLSVAVGVFLYEIKRRQSQATQNA